MPEIWRRFPEARLRVVAGPDHQRYWRMFAKKERLENLDGRIQIHGFVEDLRPLYAKASVVVVPLLVSAGTNIKVMEAMACRKAVVSTSIGCAGLDLIDRQDVLIRDNWPEFAAAVCELLSDESLRLRIAAEALQTVEARFSWTAIADRAYESYVHFTGAHAQLSGAR
jgi:glycosyltransferase involved in cell wall biosynthesis